MPDDAGPHDRWYAAPDGDAERFLGADGLPSAHLIDYGSGDGLVLRFCEDSTGLLVGPTDRRLGPAGLLVFNLRGGSYYDNDGGDFRPGADVRLVPEPDNPHDDRAVAVFDRTGRYRAGYLNKQKARAYLKRIAAGEDLVAISLRHRAGAGDGRGVDPGGDSGCAFTRAVATATRLSVAGVHGLTTSCSGRGGVHRSCWRLAPLRPQPPGLERGARVAVI
jgi:hypothetical protein